MRTRGSNWNLRKPNEPESQDASTNQGAATTPKINSGQPKIFAVEGPRQNCWLVDSAANVHMCNDKSIMTEYQKRFTKDGGSTSNGVSPGRRKFCLRLGLEDDLDGLILNLQNVYYLLNSLCNLVNLGLLNNNGIFHNNKHKNLYQITSKRVLAQAKR